MSTVLTLLRPHAVASVALFLLLGGTAYAVADDASTSAASKKSLHACVTHKHRTLT